MTRILALFAALCLTGAPASAQLAAPTGANAGNVTAELIADTTAVKPGTTFTVGILYKMQPGWHIYWKHPGGSGFATTVQWTGTPGVSLGETLYPAPISFESPGPIISYGYEGETLLMMEARAGETANGQVTINAKSRWLMCSDRCIPGKQDLTLNLPIGDPKPANQQLFAKYRQQLPQKAAQFPNYVQATGTASGNKSTFNLKITPPAGAKLSAAHKGSTYATYFYPNDEKSYTLEAPTLTGQKSADGATYEGPITITYTAQANGADAAPLKKLSGTLTLQTITNGTPGKPVLLDVEQDI